MRTIYLDYTADTPPDEQVISVYANCAKNAFANPNSTHSLGKSAKQIVDDSLNTIARCLGVTADKLILTSGASEANNLALKGIAHTQRRKGKHIISTFLEHSSVSGALTFLQEQGWEIDLVDVLPSGKIDLEHLRSLLREDTILCAVCAVDSELGTVQPVSEIALIISQYPNCHLHVDATQAIGKTKLDLSGVHTASFAPHKFYGLKGCGVLYKAKSVVLEPLIHGGASTTIYRSGTPDAPAAAACAAAFETAQKQFEQRYKLVKAHSRFLREQFDSKEKIRINSPEDAVPHILNISVRGIKGEQMRTALDEKGFCLSVKSACSVANTPSRAVMAITHDRKRALESFRISLSHLTTHDELDRFVSALYTVIENS